MSGHCQIMVQKRHNYMLTHFIAHKAGAYFIYCVIINLIGDEDKKIEADA